VPLKHSLVMFLAVVLAC